MSLLNHGRESGDENMDSYIQKAYRVRYELLHYKHDKQTAAEFLNYPVKDEDLIKFVNRLLVENNQEPLEKITHLDVLEALEVEEINREHPYLKAYLYNFNGKASCEKVLDRHKYRPILLNELFEEFGEKVISDALKRLGKSLDEMRIEQIWDLRSDLRDKLRKNKKKGVA